MKFYIFTLGCQQNYYDAHKITQFLTKLGCLLGNEKNADLIVVMGCSVRQKPVDRIYGRLNKNWAGKKVIVTACLSESDQKKLAKKGVRFINGQNFEKEIIKELNFTKRSTKTLEDSGLGYLPIMTGCDNFCTYCIVPYTRGREKSRPAGEIIKEAKLLIKNRHKEITLLGQNVNSYKYDFVELLEKIEAIPGKFKISYLTSHPKDMSDELIAWMGKSQKFSGKMHLPLQSGDDKILSAMNRKYTTRGYLKLIKKIRQASPKIDLSTDLIVGFPGETKKQFQNTLDLSKKIKFNQAYISCYCPRPGTAAAKLKDNVSLDEKNKRFHLLDKLINEKN